MKESLSISDNNKIRVLVLGASGRVGSQLVRELDKDTEDINVRLAAREMETVEKWKDENRDAVLLDLNKPESYSAALKNVKRVFLLTGYTSDMLFQSKKFVDAAVKEGVEHIVHLGVFTTREDNIPHFAWHDLIEAYIAASGIAWTNLHSNVIADGTLIKTPPITEKDEFTVLFKNMPQGWVFAEDIAAVAAAVLREGPDKHSGADYYLSTEVLTGPQMAEILSSALGRKITCNALDPSAIETFTASLPSVAEKAYMHSARITMELAAAGKMPGQTVVRDDVMTVLGRPGISVFEWAKKNLK